MCDGVKFSDNYSEKIIGKEIAKQVLEELNSKKDCHVLTIANLIAEKLNDQVTHKKNSENENKNENENEGNEEMWIFFEDTQECIPCKLQV